MRPALLVLLLLPGSLLAASPGSAEVASFEKSIRPLLHQHCLSCHSRQAGKQRGGLYLDSRADLLKGGDSGPAAVPGHPERSLLVQALRQDHPTVRMPPRGKLPALQIALVEEWVRRDLVFPGPAPAGTKATGIDLAAARGFWSFRPLQMHPAAPPPVAAWPRRRIDSFLLEGMTKQGLTPSPEADRRTLIRRLYFDMVGLPPTFEEVQAFVADRSPDAWERLVEKVLGSPAHGERWGRYWLDLVRYADVTEPWASLKGSPHLYRDWVVGAINADLPYQQFVERQLAADLLPDAGPEDRAALGFLGLAPTYWKELKLDHLVIKGVMAEEWEENIHTFSSTFLGLTVACARCHDHKYDPVSTHDYYALAGVFASVRQADLPSRFGPVRGVVEGKLDVLPDGQHRTKLLPRKEVGDVAVQVRGNPASLGPVVPRRFLSVFSEGMPSPFRQGSGRGDLARALTREGGPLAARVIVNRVWEHHFGEGLVRTPSDFGKQGERPTHPELLDDLAARFVAGGWSLKWLHREIVLSAAYRQSSRASDRDQKDPDNRWISRMPRRRLEVEAWRDALLQATGSLRRQQGGPPVSLDEATNDRRTLYGEVKRRELADLLRLHDFPDPTTHSAARIPTTTPLQQLFALNSPIVLAQSRALARRLESAEADPGHRVVLAYRLLFAREPTPSEARLGQEFLASSTWAEYAQVLLTSNEFSFVD